MPGQLHGQRSLAGYSPWGRKVSGMTERLTPPVLGLSQDIAVILEPWNLSARRFLHQEDAGAVCK